MPRLFFALYPEADVRTALVDCARMAIAAAGGRATAADNFHLTLSFLGDVPSSRVSELTAIGATLAQAATRFTTTLDRAGIWTQSAIAWLAPTTIPAPLIALDQALNRTLESHGFITSLEPHTPHITLARRIQARNIGLSLPPVSWTVDSFSLMRSERRSTRPVYRCLMRWPLGEGRVS